MDITSHQFTTMLSLNYNFFTITTIYGFGSLAIKCIATFRWLVCLVLYFIIVIFSLLADSKTPSLMAPLSAMLYNIDIAGIVILSWGHGLEVMTPSQIICILVATSWILLHQP